ncbi:MAG: hypothetical protein D5R99_03225 [Methanocalculus sp. MSAO_Arc1]|uniref:hypothetical protein n=1 Tax=Methanocalculus TaxID=71151 RepID=UPI000FED3F38|nr:MULTISPECIES: hypothetical protein [unclassified Methanocalculus]MCP1662775.1 hypothetical protein [Methanocalculus sp. AMF5]RQD81082.1 MAG: hypothetical protein D5R99_03225 [Methanocalculus sp. MSAO_Arc1]
MNGSASLFEIADQLLEYADEDEYRLARAIAGLDADIRIDLLTSDYLNAYQVYIYAFQTQPPLLIEDRLLLHPASGLKKGLFLEEIDLYELFFLMDGETPVVEIRCGNDTIATFRGKNAHTSAIRYAEAGE